MASLPRLQQGPARQPHIDRRKQTPRPCTRKSEGAAGLKHETTMGPTETKADTKNGLVRSIDQTTKKQSQSSRWK